MNDKKKNPLEGIFAQVTDDELLRENGLLYAENKQLQSNWNSLREWLEQQKTTWNRIQEHGGYDYEQILDKMNELEEEKKIPEKLDIKSDEAAPNSYYI